MTLEELKKLTEETNDFKNSKRLSGATVDFVNPENNKSTIKVFLSIQRAIDFYEQCSKPKTLTACFETRDMYGNSRWVGIEFKE